MSERERAYKYKYVQTSHVDVEVHLRVVGLAFRPPRPARPPPSRPPFLLAPDLDSPAAAPKSRYARTSFFTASFSSRRPKLASFASALRRITLATALPEPPRAIRANRADVHQRLEVRADERANRAANGRIADRIVGRAPTPEGVRVGAVPGPRCGEKPRGHAPTSRDAVP